EEEARRRAEAQRALEQERAQRDLHQERLTRVHVAQEATETQSAKAGGADVSWEVSSPSGPAYSWSAVAGEFLQEHWQKLLLCLAVLLIVVSSTMGAHRLLGPLLWSPEGKCILALVYTLLFAVFGAGLVHWGARGAGRVMLLTALAVVPVNFALA